MISTQIVTLPIILLQELKIHPCIEFFLPPSLQDKRGQVALNYVEEYIATENVWLERPPIDKARFRFAAAVLDVSRGGRTGGGTLCLRTKYIPGYVTCKVGCCTRQHASASSPHAWKMSGRKIWGLYTVAVTAVWTAATNDT